MDENYSAKACKVAKPETTQPMRDCLNTNILTQGDVRLAWFQSQQNTLHRNTSLFPLDFSDTAYLMYLSFLLSYYPSLHILPRLSPSAFHLPSRYTHGICSSFSSTHPPHPVSTWTHHPSMYHNGFPFLHHSFNQ